jgi:hypothetical protein
MFTIVCPDDKRSNNYFLGLNEFKLKKTGYQQFFMAVYHLPSGYGCSWQHLTVYIQQQNQSFSSQVHTDFNSSAFIE